MYYLFALTNKQCKELNHIVRTTSEYRSGSAMSNAVASLHIVTKLNIMMKSYD